MNLRIKNLLLKMVSLSLVCIFIYSNSLTIFSQEINSLKQAAFPVNITVGNSEKYDFKTIQEALDSIKEIPTQKSPVTIKIAKGIYEENIKIKMPYITLQNAESSNSKDVIIVSDNSKENTEKDFAINTQATVTVDKNATGFKAENITFKSTNIIKAQNEKDKESVTQSLQAVAMASMADKVVFENCQFIGLQNTLYLKGSLNTEDNLKDKNQQSRTYLKNCYIEGTINFIFGDATAYFDKCKINMIYGSGNYIAANTNLFNLGYIFNNCEFMVDKSFADDAKEKNIFIAKPWHSDSAHPNNGSHVALINCNFTDMINDSVWSVWDLNTNTDKVRYMEYNSTVNNKKSDISKRPEWIKILDENQINAYTDFNILRGTDNWNPTDKGRRSENIKVADITFESYNIEIPKGNKYKVSLNIMPLNVKNNSMNWQSENEDIFTVNNNGEITPVKEGKAILKVSSSDGSFSAKTHINVISSKTDIPAVTDIKIEYKENIIPGNTIKAVYNYALQSDKDADCATIKWYSVDSETNEEFLLKEGNGLLADSYTVQDSDVGNKIKIKVYPETKTTYGTKGEPVSYITDVTVKKPEGDYKKLYLMENFSDFYNSKYKDLNSSQYPLDKNSSYIWQGSNSNNKTPAWEIIQDDDNYFIGGANDNVSESSFLQYVQKEHEKLWGNVSVESRMRFNPLLSGMDENAYYDIYTSYNGKDKSYYKLRIQRGINTNSLKISLYKKAENSNEEILLKSDDKSLSNNINQNSGIDNPWFKIIQINNNGKITVKFILEDKIDPTLTMEVIDKEPIKNGYIAIENYGQKSVLLMDSLKVESVVNKVSEDDLVKVYLAGDSTVKAYGDDNTIGGWGEYLQYYFDSDKVKVINKAEGGRSTRSFLNQGRLDEILSEIRKDDYLFIQFGHNDGLQTDTARLEHSVFLGEPDENGIYPSIPAVKTKTPQLLLDFYKDYPYKETFYPYESGTFKWYLEQYVIKAREKGAIPVLITPVARVFFDSEGKITPHHGENDGYVKAVIQVANEMNVAYVNMFEITKSMYEDYGVQVTQGLQNVKEDGSMDITHYNKYGSNIVTSLFIKALADQHIAIAQDAVSSSRFVSKTEDMKNASLCIIGGTTVSDYYNNSEYSVSRYGWGSAIEKYFVDKIKVNNFAVEGASSKSFIKEENYKTYLNNLKQGDYVLIQFGHDEEDTQKYTDPKGSKETKGSFKYYLYNYYVKPALDKKAIPFLITPASRRIFNSDGTIQDSHNLYDDAVRELASELKTAYIDLNTVTADYYKNKGKEKSAVNHALFKDISKGERGIDNVNYNSFGAEEIAKLILNQMKYSSATLKNYIDNEKLESNNNYITKADYIVLIMDILGKTGKPKSNFIDVANGKEYTNAVGLAKEYRIAFSDENGNFNPESYLTKKDLVDITKNTLIENAVNYGDFLNEFNNLDDESYITKEQAFFIAYEVYDALKG